MYDDKDLCNTTQHTLERIPKRDSANDTNQPPVITCHCKKKGSSVRYLHYYDESGANKNTATTVNYSMPLLWEVFANTDNHNIVYLMEARNKNEKSWNRITKMCDGGTINSGIIFLKFLPSAISKINFRLTAYVRDLTSCYGNSYQGFVLNECEIQVLSTIHE